MSSTPDVAGSVLSLWRYPVKSMMGEELNAAEFTDRGLIGDRAYALVDPANGKVASAKNPRKWSQLFECYAAFAEPPRAGQKLPPVWITLPDGMRLSSLQSDVARMLSTVLGREVTFATTAPKTPSLEEYWPDIEGLVHRETITDEAMPKETFFDCAVIHVLTTATVDKLRQLYPDGRFEVRRFRPNLMVQPASAEKDFIENAWVGRTLAVGADVRLKVTGPCPRCVMTTLPQGDLPRDPGILRTAAKHNQANVGVYAAVLRGGIVRRGDQVRLDSER